MKAGVWWFALLAVSASAAHAKKPTEAQCGVAQLFVAETDAAAFLAGLQAQAGEYTAAKQEEVLSKFDAGKVAAIKAAASVPAYQAALKEFVVAASDYLHNLGSAPAAPMKSRLDQAKERVQLEGELACGT